MIVAEQKPIGEIDRLTLDYRRLLLLGCAGCVTVCLSGGEKETEIMAGALRLKRRNEGRPADIVTRTLTRQCDPEFINEVEELAGEADCIVSLACGIGPQYLAERFKDKYVVPAMNTRFAGGSVRLGVWEEKCGLCGDCILHLTGGICPIVRCPKSVLNGPCGGSRNGKCEIGGDIDCAWILILDRLKKLGRLDTLKQIIPPMDWSKSRDGGPRRMTREDLISE